MHSQCMGTNKDGSPCGAQPLPSGWCRWHDPALTTERANWRARGGERRSNASRASAALPRDLADVRDKLLGALSKLETGELEPRTAQAMASVARALVALQEAGALERATAALEASREWHTLRARIVAELRPYPDARAALAEVLSAGG